MANTLPTTTMPRKLCAWCNHRSLNCKACWARTTASLCPWPSAGTTSYQQIKDACRRDTAIALLRAQPLSGSAIAEKPGFSDASTFYRAFKK